MVQVPTDHELVIDVYRRAAEENRLDPLLKGACLHLPDYGQLVMTGDMHGHMRNFEKLVKFCVLGQSAARHVILHELVHREPFTLNDVDRSHELLYEAAHWKCAFPNQVHFLQSNHELAELIGQEITKNGRDVTLGFEMGVAETFGRNHVPKVMEAIREFLASLPLAARTPNGIFLSHSLPSEPDWPSFDPAVLERTLTMTDFLEDGSVYNLVWGRNHTPELLQQISKKLGAKFFITGHQPQEDGYRVIGDRMIILASDHNHGVFLPIDLNRKKYTIDALVNSIRRYVSVP